MRPFFQFNKKYFALAILIFLVEVLIAKYAHDRIIRPFVGDVLVVILIYCLVKSFLNTRVLPTAIGVLLFSFLIEGLQYFKIVHLLGLQDSKIAAVVIGNTFAWMDIVCYLVGIALVLFFERKNLGKQ